MTKQLDSPSLDVSALQSTLQATQLGILSFEFLHSFWIKVFLENCLVNIRMGIFNGLTMR